MKRCMEWARASCAVAMVVAITPLFAQTTAGTGTAEALPIAAQTPHITPSPLLAIDQHRMTLVDRIVREWGDSLRWSSDAGITHDQLREMLMGLRADHLLAASLAGSLTGLRDVLATSLTGAGPVSATVVQPKALGDTADDLAYTPVSPCRLFDTRPSQGGLGAMAPNVRRTYGATTPVANQGGPGGCNAPAGAAVALIQIGTLTPSGSGYLQGGAQGVASFPNALILYQPGDQYGTGVAMPLNVANGRFDVQVQFAATDLYGDLLGYFQAPTGAGHYFVQGGNTFGTTATLGTLDNQPVSIIVNNQPTLRLIPVTDANNTDTVNVINGSPLNFVDPGVVGATISGGGTNNGGPLIPNHVTQSFATIGGGAFNTASGVGATVAGGVVNIASGQDATVAGGNGNIASNFGATVAAGINNIASGFEAMVAGGGGNTASGTWSFAAGRGAIAAETTCAVFGLWSSGNASCLGTGNVFRVMGDHGFGVDYFSSNGTGGGTRWVYVGDLYANQTITAWNGAFLSDAGVWVNASSAAASKTDFRSVNPAEVLRKVAELPITTWRYKEGEGEVRHMGPMAEDFWKAFKIGYGDHTIADLDARGVEFAAIQGLHQLVREKDAQIAEQQREIAALTDRVTGLELLRGELTAVKAALIEIRRSREVTAAR